MKRLLLLSAFLLAMSACSTTPESSNANSSNTAANTNAAANTNTSATPTAGTNSVSDAITAKEKEIWDKIKAGDSNAFGSMLADDFVYVAPEAVYDKAKTIEGIKEFKPTEINLSDWKVLTPDKDVAIVIYTVKAKGTNEGNPIPETPLRCSSVWVNRGDKWVGVFHQETAVQEAPANPAGNAKPESDKSTNANTSATPPTAAEVPDPVSKEKKVWEELKRKDYNAFATDLADEAVEVEPNGVFDKAGSINGVKMLNASNYSQSDFKEMKIDADASVVTYTVKSRDGKEEERHSTVWVKRGERWYAVLHQGTPVAKPQKKA
ncbi:MAG TPA: nuclear transport factor 2 family protein [Pyrinomonadaceae bacterium]